MIVSFEHGFVFVKGIKVGGTSIELFLSQTLDEQAIVAPANFGNPAFRARNYQGSGGAANLTNHATAAQARAFLGEARFAAMRRALVIRNPYEKIRSFFYFKLGQGLDTLTVDRAIEGCASEAVGALDADGRCLITDILLYERLDADLTVFFAAVGVPFGGRLEVFEKSWQRRRFGHLPVSFSPSQEDRVRDKFAFEFACYAAAGLAIRADAGPMARACPALQASSTP